MQRHFVQELEALKERLIRMGSLAEQAIVESIRSFQERDAVLARQVLEADEAINLLEVEIDNNVVDILALQQPVASDLRFILAAQKINNDLERIGDHAVNIAESTLQYAKRDPIEHPVDIPQMAVIAKTMLREAIDAFVHSDAKLARDVLITDDEIDDLNRKMADEMADLISADPKLLHQALDFIRVSRNLERVADLATNIAEEVVFITEAQVVKHRVGEKRA
jgi:phosphate transport system protein